MNQNKIDEAYACMTGLMLEAEFDNRPTEEDLVVIAESSLSCRCGSAKDCSVEEYHEAVKQFINENLKEL